MVNPSDETEAKAALILQIEQIIEEKDLIRNVVAPQTGLTEAKFAKQIQGILGKMSLDRLQQYLAALKRNYE